MCSAAVQATVSQVPLFLALFEPPEATKLTVHKVAYAHDALGSIT